MGWAQNEKTLRGRDMSTYAKLCNILRCNKCDTDSPFNQNNSSLVCNKCGNRIKIENNIVHYSDSGDIKNKAEMKYRNNNSAEHLKHSKFPVQINQVKKFLATLPGYLKSKPVLDIGCSSGPYTNILLKKAYEVIGIDFSENSLQINLSLIDKFIENVLFVKADLHKVRLDVESFYLLMFCDVFQHLGSQEKRKSFIQKAFEYLAPGGYFYISFFNFNLKNFLKRDLHGVFGTSGITYERLLHNEIIRMFPPEIRVDSIKPMNISHKPTLDKFLSKLPGASYMSRWTSIYGHKVN